MEFDLGWKVTVELAILKDTQRYGAAGRCVGDDVHRCAHLNSYPMLSQVMTRMSSRPDPATTVASGRTADWHRAEPISGTQNL